MEDVAGQGMYTGIVTDLTLDQCKTSSPNTLTYFRVYFWQWGSGQVLNLSLSWPTNGLLSWGKSGLARVSNSSEGPTVAYQIPSIMMGKSVAKPIMSP